MEQILNWTPRHDAYCLEHGIKPCAKLLWQWLVSKSSASEQEPDLAEFNAWIEKHRNKGGYHRDTLKKAFEQLIDCNVVEPLKRFTWRIWRIKLRPINLLVNPPLPRKKSHICDSDRDLDTSNPQSVEDNGIAAAASSPETSPPSEILDLAGSNGISYRPGEAGEVLKHSLEEVLQAIAHFHRRGGLLKIANPQGWLIECLRRRWWEDAIDYYSANSPIAARQTNDWLIRGSKLGDRHEQV